MGKVINILETVGLTILFLFPFVFAWFIHPWYVCRHKKYDLEIEKAQRVSRIFWIMINTSYIIQFEGKIDYEEIRLHIVKFMCEIIREQDKKILGIVQRTKIYKESNTGQKISIISSIFSESNGTNLSDSYFKTYRLRCEFSRFYDEMKDARRTLSNEELYEMGLLKYKLKLEAQ